VFLFGLFSCQISKLFKTCQILHAFPVGSQKYSPKGDEILLLSSYFVYSKIGGWSELAPTNAPVADEPVEAVFWMDENPILPARFFFFFFHLFSTPKFYPVLPTTYLPPSYLPPTNPTPPHSIARAPETSGGCGAGAAGAGAGAGTVELERLERELELWLWSWSGWSAHEKVRTLLHFLACCNAASFEARLRSFVARCFAATQQAPEPGFGALLHVALLRVALPQRSKLWS
jgi:hypothetical protein